MGMKRGVQLLIISLARFFLKGCDSSFFLYFVRTKVRSRWSVTSCLWSTFAIVCVVPCRRSHSLPFNHYLITAQRMNLSVIARVCVRVCVSLCLCLNISLIIGSGGYYNEDLLTSNTSFIEGCEKSRQTEQGFSTIRQPIFPLYFLSRLT